MKLEVGMYVRTILGISKLVEIKYENTYVFDKLDDDLSSGDIPDEIWSCEIDDVVLKASFNIIDLIEEGDYVNGIKVKYIFEKGEKYGFNSNYIVQEKSIELDGSYEYDVVPTDFLTKNKDIKSIVTKEQYKNIEYRIGE